MRAQAVLSAPVQKAAPSQRPAAPRRGTVAKAKRAPDPDITPVWNEHGELIAHRRH